MELLAHLDSQVPLERQGNPGRLGPKDSPAPLAVQACRVLMDQQVPQVFLEWQGLLVPVVRLVLREAREQKESLVTLDLKVYQAIQVHQGRRAILVRSVQQENKAPLEQQAHRELVASRV